MHHCTTSVTQRNDDRSDHIDPNTKVSCYILEIHAKQYPLLRTMTEHK